jgi:cytochrome c
MNSFEFNKIAGAVLGTLLLVFGLQNLTGLIYHAEKPEKPGFAIEVAEAPAAGGEAAAPAAEATPIAVRLASADPAKGQAAAKACVACHSLDSGNANKVGPGLWNIVEKPIAQHEGFAYSAALKGKSAEAWTYEALDLFIANPKAYAPGTKMGYAGMKDETKRADLIAYLRTVADAPKPLPAAP